MMEGIFITMSGILLIVAVAFGREEISNNQLVGE